MTVLSINYLKREKNPNEPDIYFVQVQGPASYTSGGFSVSIPGVRTIIAASVVASGTSAYGLPTVASFTGNTVTIRGLQHNRHANERDSKRNTAHSIRIHATRPRSIRQKHLKFKIQNFSFIFSF